MDWMVKTLLKNYNPEEKELFLKAKFALFTTIMVILATFATIIYSICLKNLDAGLICIQVLGAMIMSAALGILIKGNYGAAIHTIFITTYTALWIVLFFEPNSAGLSKVNSIVLVIGLSAAMPIAFFTSRKPIVFYFLVNATLFLAFIFHLKEFGIFTRQELFDYFLDNTVALVFVFFISFNAFAINQQALRSLKKELTDRIKAEKDLLESKNLLSNHLENTPVGVVFLDLNLIVTEWNPAAEIIFGFQREEVIGKPVSMLIIPEDEEESVAAVFEDLFTGQGGDRNVNENITKNGNRIICEWYNSVLKNTDGQQIGVASLVNDITEKKKTQEMMIQSEKIMSLGGLAAGMAHEIKNPLGGIMQNAQVAFSRLTADIPANHKTAEELGTSMAAINSYMEKKNIFNLLTGVTQSGQHIIKIIENMLSFSQKSDLTRKEVNLKELIDDTIDLARNHYNPKKGYAFRTIEVIREYSRDLPIIFGQKSKIQQVLLNLLRNASEAIHSKKQEGEKPKITIRLQKGKGNIRIEVEDNGEGMDAETRRHIFEPFFTTKGADIGTGLGLSISHYIIVNDHGGELKVESIVGKGSKFIIKLPFRKSER